MKKSKSMNEMEVKGNWEVLKAKLKQQYADLTDDDLKLTEGTLEEVIGKLQVKLGKTKEEIQEIISKI